MAYHRFILPRRNNASKIRLKITLSICYDLGPIRDIVVQPFGIVDIKTDTSFGNLNVQPTIKNITHALIILNRVERVISTELRVVVARISMSKGITPTSYRVLTQNGGCRGLIDSYVIETIFSSAGISLNTQIRSYG